MNTNNKNNQNAVNRSFEMITERFNKIKERTEEYRTGGFVQKLSYIGLAYFFVQKFILVIPYFQEMFLIMSFGKMLLFYGMILLISFFIYLLASLITKLLLYVFN